MTEKENKIGSINYLNKDFQTIYPELLDKASELSYKWNPSLSNESDAGVVLIKENALIADKINYNIDKNILETFPISVSQESNARQLFAELGYTMGWYKSATTSISMRWNVSESDITFTDEDTLTLPMFTMVSDENQNVVYTLLDKATFRGNDLNSTISVSAMQGVIHNYQSITDETKITALNLDNERKLYFNDYNIAENGIFINNIGQENYSEWKKVDNIATQEYGSLVYQFGVDTNTQLCYIQFPEDITDLIGDGLEIRYITTLGKKGNVASGTITKLYNDISYENLSTTLTSDVVSVVTASDVLVNNVSASTDGADTEDIESAYDNYKKTVGTFDTLVTLRDYENYLRKNKYISNGFVCDRTNDIQSVYNIINTQKGFEDYTRIMTQTEAIDDLEAFDLKLYAFSPVTLSSTDVLGTQVEYEQSFKLISSTATATDTIINELYNVKSAQHDFADIKPNELCLLLNKYAINCKIIPYSKLTSEQITDLKKLIVNALTRKLQSSKVEFGEEISYDEIYTYISECDTRIKSVVLDEMNYTTYCVYYDGQEFQEVPINNEAGKIEGQAPSKFILSTEKPRLWEKSFTDYYVRQGTEDSYTYTQLSKYKAPTFETSKYAEITLLSVQPTDWASSYANYYVYDYANNSYSKNTSNVFVADTYFKISTLTSEPDDWQTEYSKYYVIPTSGGVYTNVEGIGITAPYWVANTYYIPARVKFRQEIFAKSVLAGRTQFLKPSSDFLYTVYQKPLASVKDVETLSTYVNVTLSENDYTVKENEQVIFVAPKLIDTESYSNYVKFIVKLNSVSDGGVSQIKYNTSYKLKANEYIAFFYKQTSESSNDDDVPYTCKCYGENTIIKPSFTIYNSDNILVDLPTSAIPTSTDGEPTVTEISFGETNYNKIKNNLGTNNTLSSGKNLIVQKLSPETIKSDSGYSVYWITKTIIDDYYVLDFDENNSHILTENEYFMFTTADRNEFVVLGSGYMLTLNSRQSGVQWKCKKIDYTTIAQGGQSAISEQSAFIPIVDKLGQNDTLVCQDMEIVTIPQNYQIKAVPTGDNTNITLGSTRFTELKDFTLSYKASTEESYTALTSLSIDSVNWQGKATLSLNLNAVSGQTLAENQVIVAQTENDKQYVFASSYRSATFEAPVWSRDKYYYINDSGDYVLITSEPDDWTNEWGYTYIKNDSGEYIDTPPYEWENNYNTYYTIDNKGIFTINSDSVYYSDTLYFITSSRTSHLQSNYSIIVAGGQNLNTLVLVNNKVQGIDLFAYTDVNTSTSSWSDYLSKTPNSDGSITINCIDTTKSAKIYRYVPVYLIDGKYVVTVTKIADNNNVKLYVSNLGLCEHIGDPISVWTSFDTFSQTTSKNNDVYYNFEIKNEYLDKAFIGIEFTKSISGDVNSEFHILPFWEYSVDEQIFNSYASTIAELDKDGLFDYTHIVDDSELVSDPLDSTTSTNFNSSGQCFFDTNHIFNKFTIAKGIDLLQNISIINKVK